MPKTEKRKKSATVDLQPTRARRDDSLRELNRALARLNRETLIQIEVTKKKRKGS